MATYAHPEYLVDTAWVNDHLKDTSIRIVESDEDPLLYPMGHIPGSLQVDWFTHLQDPVRRDFVSRIEFEKVGFPVRHHPRFNGCFLWG